VRVRAVIDTNVVVSAVLNPDGTPGQVVRAAGRAFVLVWSRGIVAECLEVVGRERIARRVRRAVNDEEAGAMIARLAGIAELVPDERLPLVRIVKSDPTDDLFLATALAGGARVLVSGDRRHLLPLKEYAGVRIIDAATFARELALPGFPASSGSVHEPVAPYGDGMAALAREAQRWARAQARRDRRRPRAPRLASTPPRA
jgi:putative PIN family toxin of toxin-antitoxin system